MAISLRYPGWNKQFLLIIFWFFLLGTSFSVELSGQSYHQLRLEEKAPLVQVLDTLSARYAIDFSYNNEDCKNLFFDKNTWKASTAEQLIRSILDESGLMYTFSGPDNILLKPTIQHYSTVGESSKNCVVLDLDTEKPLTGVLVAQYNTSWGTTTDERGMVKLPLGELEPEKRVHFQILGYAKRTFSLSELSDLNTIFLKQDTVRLTEVVVTPAVNSLPNTNRLQPFNAQAGPIQLKDLPGATYQDVFRSIQFYPGITAHDDFDSSIKIRGSNGDETLILLDGIPIYKADHFFGIFSSVNSAFIDQFFLYKNTLPIEYGGKTGGLLQMTGPEHQSDFSGEVTIDLLSSSARLNIPFGKMVSLSVAGRTTYKDASQHPIFDAFKSQPVGFSVLNDPVGEQRNMNFTSETDFRFHDINAKLNIDLNPKNQLSLNLFNSHDDFVNQYETRYDESGPMRNGSNQETYFNSVKWQNLGLSGNYTGSFQNNWLLDGSLYFSKYEEDNELETSLFQFTEADTIKTEQFNEQFNELQQTGVNLKLQKDWTPQKLTLETGGSIDHFNNFLDLRTDSLSLLQRDNTAIESRFFSNVIWTPGNWTIELGNRLIHYSGTQKWYLAPQALVNFKVSPSFLLKSAWGRNYQFNREIVYENRFGESISYVVLSDDGEIPAGRSDNFMIGVTLKRPNWQFDTEIFYKNMDGVTEFALTQNGFNNQSPAPPMTTDYRLFTGTGVAVGIDALLTANYGPYQGWLAYTLSKVTNRFKEIDRNKPFAAQNDRRHQLKTIHQFKVGKFEFGTTYILASGRPYTDVSTLQSDIDRRDIPSKDRQKRLPAYHRIDLNAAVNFNVGKVKSQLGLSIFNLTNHENVSYLQFIYALPASEPPPNNPNPGNPPPPNNEVFGTSTNLLNRTLNASLTLLF